jgi:signal transduction histidine kinase
MRKSLRTQLFVQAVVCLAVIVAGNRLLSRYVAHAYVVHRFEQAMAATLRQCQGLLADEQHFRTCAAEASLDSLVESLSLHLLPCPTGLSTGARAPVCAPLMPGALQWQPLAQSGTDVGPVRLQQSQVLLQGKTWLVFRAQDQGAGVLLLEAARLDAFVDSIWNIRDRVFVYVVPLLVLAMVFLSWFVIRQLMRPLNQLQNTLARLSSSNLDQPVHIAHPHREFVGVIAAIEELRGRLHASFLQSQRFSADASHELRTPLTILRGHVEQAIAEVPTGSATQIRLRVMEEEIGRLVDVTEKLLLLSRADAHAIQLQKVGIDFSDFLSELVSDAALFGTDLRISAQVEPCIYWHCDALLVRQLLLNLYTNAVNYNIEKGWIHFTAKQSDDWLYLTVENPTQHFSPELSQKAFDRFYRGSASRTRHGSDQGLGLGLSLCREIAHLHGGTLTLVATGPTDGPYQVRAQLRVPLQA